MFMCIYPYILALKFKTSVPQRTLSRLPAYIHTYIHTYIYTHIYTYIYIYIYIHTCIYIYIHIYICIVMFIYACLHICIYIYVCTYVYMYVCICCNLRTFTFSSKKKEVVHLHRSSHRACPSPCYFLYRAFLGEI